MRHISYLRERTVNQYRVIVEESVTVTREQEYDDRFHTSRKVLSLSNVFSFTSKAIMELNGKLLL